MGAAAVDHMQRPARVQMQRARPKGDRLQVRVAIVEAERVKGTEGQHSKRPSLGPVKRLSPPRICRGVWGGVQPG